MKLFEYILWSILSVEKPKKPGKTADSMSIREGVNMKRNGCILVTGATDVT